MRGPILQSMIDKQTLNLPKSATVDDFETLYTLLLEARGETSTREVAEPEERLALTILCRFPRPGKRPEFVNGICALLSNYQGVSRNEQLQQKFRARLSSHVVDAQTIDDLRLARVREVFRKGHA